MAGLVNVGCWCPPVSCCLSIYRFGNGLLGFLPPVVVFLKMKLDVQCSCDGKDKAPFQGNVFSYSLNLAITWVLRHQLPGVRSSAIFHLASEFSLSERLLEELNVGRQKERPVKTQEAKVASFWRWWFMEGFDEVRREWVMKEVKEILIKFRLKCVGMTCTIAENTKRHSRD